MYWPPPAAVLVHSEPPPPAAVRRMEPPEAAATVTIQYRCTVCQSSYDDNSHAPRRTPCCRRLLCGKCAYVVVSHPTPPPCCFCTTAAPLALEMKAFVVDVGVMEAATAMAAPLAPYVTVRFVHEDRVLSNLPVDGVHPPATGLRVYISRCQVMCMSHARRECVVWVWAPVVVPFLQF